jgi:hypothetical protein
VPEDSDEKLAEECEAGQSQFIREGFVISCDSYALLGCSDEFNLICLNYLQGVLGNFCLVNIKSRNSTNFALVPSYFKIQIELS